VTTVFVTAPREAAADLAWALVEEQLAACVNRVDCASVYRWEDTVHEDAEAVLFVKTRPDRYDALVERIETLHPHDVPCIERFDEDDVLDAYATWRDEATEPPHED
jgi:periplasmic divalent cation tolerance protein